MRSSLENAAPSLAERMQRMKAHLRNEFRRHFEAARYDTGQNVNERRSLDVCGAVPRPIQAAGPRMDWKQDASGIMYVAMADAALLVAPHGQDPQKPWLWMVKVWRWNPAGDTWVMEDGSGSATTKEEAMKAAESKV